MVGKVALVTGGSRGIGAATVKRLAADGADVAFSYAASPDRAQQVLKDIEGLNVRTLAVKADQVHSDQVARLVHDVHRHFGRLDVLVNNAGVTVMGSVADPKVDVADVYERQFAINVNAVATAVRTAVPLISDGGRIITIGSVFGARSPVAGIGAYSATKAAVVAYARSWARDLGSRGITVNVIQPGAIDTELNPKDSEFAPFLIQLAALGRYGKPEDIAAAVAFLAGPDAGYITGTTLNVDGGHLT